MNMMPPRAAQWLIEKSLPPEISDAVTGDLTEVFRTKCTTRSELAARIWYIGQAVAFATAFTRERVRERFTQEHNMIELHKPARSPGSALEGWMRDFGISARRLRRAPGFTFIVVLTLGLAIGANTAIFSVVNRVLLHPLAFPKSEELVTIHSRFAPGAPTAGEFGIGPEYYVEYKKHAANIVDAGLFQNGQTTVRSGEHVERLFFTQSVASLFSTLGAQPVLGRLPNEDDDNTRALISYGLWSSWFGRDSSVLGRTIEVLGRNVTIIGVMGPDFRYPSDENSVWALAKLGDKIQPGSYAFAMVARVKPGTTNEQLSTQLAPIARTLPEIYGGTPAYARNMQHHTPVVTSLRDSVIGNVDGPLLVILGTVAIIFLIACANIANLLIVRAEGRRRDTAVRLALGAERRELIRAYMSEAILLGALGGVAGALVAWVGIPVLVRIAPEGIPRLDTVSLDATTIAFTAVVSMLAACLFGLVPAIRFSRPNVTRALRDSNRTTARDHLLRNTLVVVQTAAALILLVGSGLLIRSFAALSHVDPGYETKNLLTFQMAPDARAQGLTDAVSLARFHYDFLDRLKALPGVQSVGLVNEIPLDEGAGAGRFVTTSPETKDTPVLMRATYTAGDYFQTMGIRLLSGHYFARIDVPGPVVEVMVSKSAADQFWPGLNPIGQQLRRAQDSLWMTVSGVVEDVMLSDFREAKPAPLIYMPMLGFTAQSWGVGTPVYVIKSPRADVMVPDVRALVKQIAPSAPLYRVFTMERLAARSYAQLKFTMITIAIAASLALLLGSIGLYAVLSYVVAQRTREIGIRMALGAGVTSLRRMVVVEGGRVALIGIVIGVGGSLLLTRTLERMLYGVARLDVVTFIAMSVLLFGVALVASYVPARRASSVDPIRSLRAE